MLIRLHYTPFSVTLDSWVKTEKVEVTTIWTEPVSGLQVNADNSPMFCHLCITHMCYCVCAVLLIRKINTLAHLLCQP
jgi:hypothetical protein